MRILSLILLLCLSVPLHAQVTPTSPVMMTLGPVDGEADAKSTVITIRYSTKPGFEKPKVEAFGSFLQVSLPRTMVPRPGVFIDANSPYIRKMAAFQLDEQTAGLRLFVTKEAAHLLPAVTTDILENRVVIMLDHAAAEKSLLANFDGAPVEGGPSPEDIVQRTAVRNDIPDPVAMTKAPASAEEISPDASLVPLVASKAAIAKPLAKKSVAAKAEASNEDVADWSTGIEKKLVIVTIFIAVMLVLLIGLKSWRRMASKSWPLTPAMDFSMKTLASHAVGPKQKVTVIQVGNEQILIGVSPDQINFLTAIKKPGETPLFAEPAMKSLQPSPKRPAPAVLEESARRPLAKRPASERLPEPGSSIAYGISDQGIKNLKSQTSRDDDGHTVDDVTKLIRKKLRDLPRV